MKGKRVTWLFIWLSFEVIARFPVLRKHIGHLPGFSSFLIYYIYYPFGCFTGFVNSPMEFKSLSLTDNIRWEFKGKMSYIVEFFMPPPVSVGVHIVSPLSVHTYVRPVRPVHNTFGFCAISFERIGVLDWNFIHRYIIIKCRLFDLG